MGAYTDELCTKPRTPLPKALTAILRLGGLDNHLLIAAPSLRGHKAKFDLWLCARRSTYSEATTLLADNVPRWTLQEWEPKLDLDRDHHTTRLFNVPPKNPILAVCSPEWINDKDRTSRFCIGWTLEHMAYWEEQAHNAEAFQQVSGQRLYCNVAPLSYKIRTDWSTNG